jgi:hypothetical protein
MAFSAHGKYWYKEDSWRDYLRVPWSTISHSSRRKIMKHLLPKPEACPFCGAAGRMEEIRGFVLGGTGITERVLMLVNRSGKMRYCLDDWYWTCRACYHKEQSVKNQKYPVGPGDKVKPWSDLSRRGKVSRIRKALPKPVVCQYCDCSTVELTSRSGTWPEDLSDYAWCCRTHARALAQLASYHTVKTPYWQARERERTIQLLRELFPWLYYNSMGGSFKGHSILNKTSAGGRFYTISDGSFNEWLRS